MRWSGNQNTYCIRRRHWELDSFILDRRIKGKYLAVYNHLEDEHKEGEARLFWELHYGSVARKGNKHKFECLNIRRGFFFFSLWRESNTKKLLRVCGIPILGNILELNMICFEVKFELDSLYSPNPTFVILWLHDSLKKFLVRNFSIKHINIWFLTIKWVQSYY